MPHAANTLVGWSYELYPSQSFVSANSYTLWSGEEFESVQNVSLAFYLGCDREGFELLDTDALVQRYWAGDWFRMF